MRVGRGPLFLLCGAMVACDPDTPKICGDAGADANVDGTVAEAGGSGGSGGGTVDAGPGFDSGDAQNDVNVSEGGEEEEGGNPYSHTIIIDGTNDFELSNEEFPTSSGPPASQDLYLGYITWDMNFLYVGMKGRSVGDKSNMDWVIAYVGGTPGAQSGVPYKDQAPTLPFPSAYHVRWKCDGSYTNLQKWSDSTNAWVDAGNNIQAASSGTFMEMAIARLELGNPQRVQIILAMLREEPAIDQWTWAGVPSTTFTDGKDPDYAKYFEFDLSSPNPPRSYSPKP